VIDIKKVIAGGLLAIGLSSCSGGASGGDKSLCWSDVTLFAWKGIAHYEETRDRLYADAKHTILLSPDYTTESKLTTDLETMIGDGIKVWLLIGANENGVYPTDEYITKYLDFAKNYNQNHTQKITGITLDIEIWTKFNDQRSPDNKTEWEKYLTYIEDVKDKISTDSLHLSVEVPRWLSAIGNEPFPNAKPVSHDILDIVDELVIMDYTNDVEAFYSDVESDLSYADSVGKSVKLALELGTQDPQKDIVSFYANPNGIIQILTKQVNHSSFDGYAIHTLDDLYSSQLDISDCRI
jgi:hypothetical protein